MKTIILIIISFLSVLNLGLAQDFKLGVKAGFNFTKIKTDSKWFASESKAGYQAGIWTRVGGQVFHIQPEAYFSSKTAAIHPDIKDVANDFYKGNIRFTNIDVPILLGTRFPIGPLKAKLQGGPLFSFVIQENNPYKDNIDDAVKDALANYKDRFSAIVVGTGFDIANFSIDLRYEYGLGNISNYGEKKQTLNLWTLSLGLSLL